MNWFDCRRRYGFIRVRGAHDVFVGATELLESDALQPGDRVHFDVRRGTKGLRAVNVRVCNPPVQGSLLDSVVEQRLETIIRDGRRIVIGRNLATPATFDELESDR